VLPHLGDAYSPARWITGSRADAELNSDLDWGKVLGRESSNV
jgi:hypothetical protein